MNGPANSSASPPMGMWVHPKHLPQAFLTYILRLSQGSPHAHELSPLSRMQAVPTPLPGHLLSLCFKILVRCHYLQNASGRPSD